jgi:hypothetical protein
MPIFRCIATEEAANRWGTAGGLEHWVDESECHLGTIDALRLFQSPKSEAVFCLSGARDREIKLWRMGSEEVDRITLANLQHFFSSRTP